MAAGIPSDGDGARPGDVPPGVRQVDVDGETRPMEAGKERPSPKAALIYNPIKVDAATLRASVERLASGQGIKRAAATLKFNAFACGNQNDQACTVSACKSVGYSSGVPITVDRRGTGPLSAPVAIREATCYDM